MLLYFLVSIIFNLSIFAKDNIVYLIPPPANNKNGYLNDDNKFIDLTEPSGQYTGMRFAYFRLKQLLPKLGYELKLTSPSKNLKNVAAILDHDCMHPVNSDSNKWRFDDLLLYKDKKRILIMGEPELGYPNNFIIDRSTQLPTVCNYFSKIFATRDDLLINDKTGKVTKIYFPEPLLKMIDNPIPFSKKKLCILVAGDKSMWFKEKKSGYVKRKEWVNFCQKNKIKDFDLYGGYFGTTWENVKIYKGPIPTYTSKNGFDRDTTQGLVDKINLIKKYKFYLCYENEIDTWITEKITDCFAAGCVPIYWGARNILSYIPANCFIDRRKFKNNWELYTYIKSMNEETYNQYLINIKRFLASNAATIFSVEYFLDTILENILPGYDKTIIFNEAQLQIIRNANLHQEYIRSKLYY